MLLGMIPINFYVLNPMKMALKDFDFNDIAYSRLVNNDRIKMDSQITIVNIGKLDREEIGYLIEKIAAKQPEVIGLDALFEGERDTYKDSVLRSVLQKTPNLVAGCYLIPNDTFTIREDYFHAETPLKGYVNFVTETVGTRRLYSPFEVVDGKRFPSFTSALVGEFNKEAFQKLEKRKNAVEYINYTRRVTKYPVIQPEEVLNDQFEDYLLKNRIVLIGYLSDSPNDIEDKMFTPLNEKSAGKSHPDMNGIVVHANILSMALSGNYIKKTPKWVAWLVAVLIGWIHMSLFIRYYLDNHIWFHLVAKLAQVFSVIFFAYLGMIIYDKFRIKLDMKYTLYVIALSVDVIYFYEALVTWLHKKYGYSTIFSHHHHEQSHSHH
jgi:CHASE2 domain-containing sensor protein